MGARVSPWKASSTKLAAGGTASATPLTPALALQPLHGWLRPACGRSDIDLSTYRPVPAREGGDAGWTQEMAGGRGESSGQRHVALYESADQCPIWNRWARETNARFGTGTNQPARFTATMRAALLLPASMATVLESGRADRDRDPMAAVSQLARFDPIAPPRMPMPRWRTRRCAHIFKRCSGLCCSWWLLDARA